MTYISLILVLGCAKPQDEPKDVATNSVLVLDGPSLFSGPGTQTATGLAADFEQLTIEGELAKINDDGSFEAPVKLVRGLNTIEALATEPDGDTQFTRRSVLAGSFSDPDAPVERALEVRLNRGGLALIEGAINDYVRGPALTELLTHGTLYQDQYGVAGVDLVTIAVEANNVGLGEPEISATPTNDGLGLNIELRELYIELQATGSVLGAAFSTTLWVASQGVSVGTKARMAVDEDGELNVALLDTDVSLLGFEIDSSAVPGEVDKALLSGAIRSAIENKAVDAISSAIPGLLSDKLSNLGTMEVTVVGNPANISVGIADVAIDDDGIGLELDLGVVLPAQPAPGGIIRAARPDPLLSNDADLSLAVVDDFVNVAFYQAWRAGLLNIRLSSDDGTLPVAVLEKVGATTGSISVEAGLPPVLMQRASGPVLQIGELMVSIDTPGGSLGDHMLVALALQAQLDVDVRNSQLVLKPGDIDVAIDVRQTTNQARTTTMTRLIQEMLPIDALLAPIDEIEVAVPELAGFEIFHADVQRDPGGSHITMDLYVDTVR